MELDVVNMIQKISLHWVIRTHKKTKRRRDQSTDIEKDKTKKDKMIGRQKKPVELKRQFSPEYVEKLMKQEPDEKEKAKWQAQYQKVLRSHTAWKGLSNYSCMKRIASENKQDVYGEMINIRAPLFLSVLKDISSQTACFAGNVVVGLNRKTDEPTFLRNNIDLKKCENRSLLIIFVSIRFSSSDRGARMLETKEGASTLPGHAVAVLIDKKTKEIEMYDPHGDTDLTIEPLLLVSDYLKATYKELEDYEIVESSKYCPMLPGIQATYNVGLCANFTFLYILSRALAPEKTAKQVLKELNSLTRTQLVHVMAHVLCFLYDYARYNKYLLALYLLRPHHRTVFTNHAIAEEANALIEQGNPESAIELLFKTIEQRRGGFFPPRKQSKK